MKNKDSKARMQMIFGILLFAFIFMAELYAIVNFPKMFIVLVVLAAADLICLYVAIRGVISVLCLCRHAKFPEFFIDIFHVCCDSLTDCSEIVIVHFLTLWRHCPEKSTSGKDQILTL